MLPLIQCCTPLDTGGGKHFGHHAGQLGAQMYFRICAGKSYAEAMGFMSMARLLATFDITTEKDEYGRDIVPPLKFKSLVVR